MDVFYFVIIVNKYLHFSILLGTFFKKRPEELKDVGIFHDANFQWYLKLRN